MRVNEWRQRINSPRIESLRRELKDRPHAIDEFWQSVAESGAPLVEEIPGDDDARCVTFIYRDWNGDLDHVLLCGPIVMSDLSDNLLLRVGDSDLMTLSLRLPADTRTTYLLSPNDPLSSLFTEGLACALKETQFDRESGDYQAFLMAQQKRRPDPLNRRQWPDPRHLPVNEWGVQDSGQDVVWIKSLLELPGATTLVWSRPPSADEAALDLQSTIHESDLGGIRRVWFLQVGTTPPERLLVVLDGWAFIHMMHFPSILTRLHQAGLIPPMAVAFVDCGTPTMRMNDYTGSRAHSDYLATEVVPMAARHFGINPTPARTVICGCSGGGITSLATGFRYPDVFGNILAQAPPVMLKHDDLPDGYAGEAAKVAPEMQPRVHIQVGLLEVDQIWGDQVLDSNRKFAQKIASAGFDVVVDEESCGHDPVQFGESAAKGLMRLCGIRAF